MTYVSNLFDTFFAGGKDHRTRVSAGNMPYLEGVRRVAKQLLVMLLCQVSGSRRRRRTTQPAEGDAGLDGGTTGEAFV